MSTAVENCFRTAVGTRVAVPEFEGFFVRSERVRLSKCRMPEIGQLQPWTS